MTTKFKDGDRVVKVRDSNGHDVCGPIGVTGTYNAVKKIVNLDGGENCDSFDDFELLSSSIPAEKIKKLIEEGEKFFADLKVRLVEASKSESVWDLGPKDKCWIISGKASVIKYSAQHKLFKTRRDKGDVFLTEKSAREELAKRREVAKNRKEGLIL